MIDGYALYFLKPQFLKSKNYLGLNTGTNHQKSVLQSKAKGSSKGNPNFINEVSFMNSLTQCEKTFILFDIIDAQAHFIQLRKHNYIVRELEELIGEAYRSGNEPMEQRFRDCLDLYEQTRYDL